MEKGVGYLGETSSPSTCSVARKDEEARGSGLPVLSCEKAKTFGGVITRRTALGVISDSCLCGVFAARSLYGATLALLC